MSISTDLTRLQSAKAAMKTAIQGKGVTVPDSAKLDAFAALIDSIPYGGGYTAEVHVVTFAETVTCAEGGAVELCDATIQTPLCLGMVAYSDNAAVYNLYVPVLSFGMSSDLTGNKSASGHAFGTSSGVYGTTGKAGLVILHTKQDGSFNVSYDNGLYVKNGKLRWSNNTGIGYNGANPASFPAGTTYIFLIMGAST